MIWEALLRKWQLLIEIMYQDLSIGSKQRCEHHNPSRDSKDSSLSYKIRALSLNQTDLLRTLYEITLQITNFIFMQCHKYIKFYTFASNNSPYNILLYKNSLLVRDYASHPQKQVKLTFITQFQQIIYRGDITSFGLTTRRKEHFQKFYFSNRLVYVIYIF
jgi:hypothetical protein